MTKKHLIINVNVAQCHRIRNLSNNKCDIEMKSKRASSCPGVMGSCHNGCGDIVAAHNLIIGNIIVLICEPPSKHGVPDQLLIQTKAATDFLISDFWVIEFLLCVNFFLTWKLSAKNWTLTERFSMKQNWCQEKIQVLFFTN